VAATVSGDRKKKGGKGIGNSIQKINNTRIKRRKRGGGGGRSKPGTTPVDRKSKGEAKKSQLNKPGKPSAPHPYNSLLGRLRWGERGRIGKKVFMAHG